MAAATTNKVKSRVKLKTHTVIIKDICLTDDGLFTCLRMNDGTPWKTTYEELSDGSGYRIIKTLTTTEVKY